MILQDKLDALKKDFQTQAPPEILEIMRRATEDLDRSGILDRTVKVGARAPDFTLTNTKGNSVTLKQLISQGPLILGFYRGRW
jgi:hypothetical protein